MKKIFITTLILICSAILIGCNNSNKNDNSNSKFSDSFKIYLIEGKHIDELPYEYSDKRWIDFLDNAELKNIFISNADIEEYDWKKQEMILTEKTSLRIREEMSLNRFSFIEKTFVVSLDGNKTYGGSIIEIFSARAINYPVIYISDKGDKITLNIRPKHDLYSPDYQISGNDIINKEEIKIYFKEKDKLINY